METNRVERFYFKLAQGRIVAVFGFLYAASQLMMFRILSRLGSDPLMLQITFSKERFLEILGGWGRWGVGLYKSHYWFDFVHPIWYSIFLASFIAWLSAKKGVSPSKGLLLLFCLPFAAGLCDLVENTFHVLMLNSVIRITAFSVAASAAFANTKWLLAGISLAAIIVLGIKKAKARH
ncbi:MAG: hypothetical protein QMD09_12355 [Desulfatibacillaceae bacterium]|nr:hypothetical protein [Desulfatibacillaceae bacterium]